MTSQSETWLPRSSVYMSRTGPNPMDDVAPLVNPRLALIYSMMSFHSEIGRSVLGIKLNSFDGFTPHVSLFVGDGASFTVTRDVVQVMSSGVPVPTLAVLKRPRYDRMADDHPGWKSLILEFRALSFRPSLLHDNIVDLFGLVWDDITPVMVVECATYGTLAMLEQHNLREKTQFRLCHDVARALHFLHTCSIIHGDVKSENVLIFRHSERRFIAKLGDFGGSVLDMEEESLLQSGTQPWSAPEWREKLKKDKLSMTDTYSFGLLFWRTLLRRDPFSIRFLFDLPLEPAARLVEIQSLKQRDEVLAASFKSIKRGLPATQWILNILLDSLSKDPMRRSLDRVLLAFHELERIEDPYETTRLAHHSVEVMEENHDKLVFDMKARLSRTGSSYRNTLFPLTELAMDEFMCLPSHLRILLVEDLQQASTSTSFSRAACHLQLSFITLTLSQSAADDCRAFAYLVSAAQHGSEQAEKFLYRFSTALNQEIPDTMDILLILKRHTLHGSRLALQDLKSVDPVLFTQALTELRCLYHHRRFSVFETMEDAEAFLCVSALDRKLSDVRIHVNAFFSHDIPGGDGKKHVYHLLHLAAEHGFVESVDYLLDRGASINQRNVIGETALLLACRDGHAGVALLLIKCGADVTIPDQFGETPLHWLCAFDVQDVPELAMALRNSGANIEAQAQHPGDNNLVDGVPRGIPLDYAVRYNNEAALIELLTIAEHTRPALNRMHHTFNSLYLACKCHAASILTNLLEYVHTTEDEESMILLISQLLRCFVEAGGRLHDIVFGGFDHVHTFATLAVLNSHGRIFTKNIGDLESALALAVTLDRCTLVDYILQTEPEFSIDSPCSLDGKTALQLAIKSGALVTFNLLIERGADISRIWRFWNSLHLCGLARADDALGIGRRLMTLGMSADPTNAQCETPFHCAVLHKSFQLAEELLLHGADINATLTRAYPSYELDEPMTLLGFILYRNSESDIVSLKFLLKHLNPRHDNVIMVSPTRKRTFFHHASCLHSIHCIDNETLLRMVMLVLEWWKVDEGTKIDVLSCLDDEGHSALHLAAVTGNTNMVEILLSEGADPKQRSVSGWTARCIAQYQKNSIGRLPETNVVIEQRKLYDTMLRHLDAQLSECEVSQSLSMHENPLRTPPFPDVDVIPPFRSLFLEPFEDSRRVVVSQLEISQIRTILHHISLPPQCIPTVMDLSSFSAIQTLTIREQCVSISAAVSEDPEERYLLSEPIRGFSSPPLVGLVFRVECLHEEIAVGENHQATGMGKDSGSWFAASILREGKEVTPKYVVTFKDPGVTVDLVVQWTDHPILSTAKNGDQVALWVAASLPERQNHICRGKILTYITPYTE